MKVVIDNKIPFIKGLLEPLADISYIEGNKIGKKDILNADALIVRTRTKIDSSLLSGTAVKYIGSATIGTDHIDTGWCRQNGIHCAASPGCNAGSVNQYILSALAILQNKFRYKPENTTIGIVGVGNVGKKVAASVRLLGYNVLLNDPPRSRIEGPGAFVSLDKLLENSDIITVHVPLTLDGRDKTHHLICSDTISKAKKGVILINTSRGGVVDEKMLLSNLKSGKIKACVTDVWEGEPNISRELLTRSTIATPHIAGYSSDGKLRASTMIIEDFARFFKLPQPAYNVDLPSPEDPIISIKEWHNTEDLPAKAILHTYPIMNDHHLLLKNPDRFEELRNNYPNRREFDSYTINKVPDRVKNILKDLGFRV